MLGTTARRSGAQWPRTIMMLAGLCIVLVGPASAQSLMDRAKGLLDGGGNGDAAASLADSEVRSGLKEALALATRRAVDQVGVKGGYSDDPAIHIPLPGSLERVQSALRSAGMGGMADDLERRMNRAAEAAAPEARAVFVDSVREMSWQEARDILSAENNDAATQYFRRTMSDRLKQRMRPIVADQLGQVGALQSYDEMIGAYRDLPLVPDVKADLTDYTLSKGLDGLFHYVAKEEARIRANPAARTTELLRKVFGG